METLTIAEKTRDNIKVWGAIILGKDKKYGLKREFKSFRIANYCSSKHIYYDYFIDAEENQFIEVGIKGMYKNKRYYYKVKNNNLIQVKLDEILEKYK